MSANANLFARLAGGFPADRGQLFLETEGGVAVSFADLLERAGRIAALLAASGVVPGDRVAVQVEKSVGNVCLYLAVLQVGAVYVPLNSGYTPVELAYFLADAEPKVVVCDPSGHDAIAPLVAGRGWLFTLGATGRGNARRAGDAAAVGAAGGGADGERPRGDPLHLGDDRALEGGDAHPGQSLVEHGDLACLLGVPAGRRADPRAAALYHTARVSSWR